MGFFRAARASARFDVDFGGSIQDATRGGKPLKPAPDNALSMSFASDGRGLDAASAPAGERRRLKLRPLVQLAPYIGRYKGRAVAALASLIVAAATTLIVPVAVRRMIDFGFSRRRPCLMAGNLL